MSLLFPPLLFPPYWHGIEHRHATEYLLGKSCRTDYRNGSQARPSLSRVTPSVGSELFLELLGCPISSSLSTSCVCLELRPLSSTSITRNGGPVDLCNDLFEACSAFTHIRACTLALSPYVVTPFTRGFNHFVTSIVAPVASGWSGCRVGLSPTGKHRLITAHARSGHCEKPVQQCIRRLTHGAGLAMRHTEPRVQKMLVVPCNQWLYPSMPRPCLFLCFVQMLPSRHVPPEQPEKNLK